MTGASNTPPVPKPIDPVDTKLKEAVQASRQAVAASKALLAQIKANNARPKLCEGLEASAGRDPSKG